MLEVLSFPVIVLLCLLVSAIGFHLYRSSGFKGVIEYTQNLLDDARADLVASRQDAARLSNKSVALATDLRFANEQLERDANTIWSLRAEVRELANAPKVRYKNAEEALQNILFDGPVSSTDCLAQMEDCGYSESSTYTAKSALDVTSQKVNGTWLWIPLGFTADDYNSVNGSYPLGTVGNPGVYGETATA